MGGVINMAASSSLCNTFSGPPKFANFYKAKGYTSIPGFISKAASGGKSAKCSTLIEPSSNPRVD
jgi:hypothetical protein